jgi:hypothetical protein
VKRASKTPQTILWIASSPFGGGADNKVQRNHPSVLRTATLFVKEGNLISRFATASPIGEAFVRRVAPRSFGYALARKGQGRRLRLAQDDMVGLV